jgi:hypothetical protein
MVAVPLITEVPAKTAFDAYNRARAASTAIRVNGPALSAIVE